MVYPAAGAEEHSGRGLLRPGGRRLHLAVRLRGAGGH